MGRKGWLRRTLAALLFVLTAVSLGAQRPAPANGDQQLLAGMHAISSETLFGYVKELASPKYQGRLTGTAGFNAAAPRSGRPERSKSGLPGSG